MSGQTPVRPASNATGITDAEVEAALAGWKYFTDQYGTAYPEVSDEDRARSCGRCKGS